MKRLALALLMASLAACSSAPKKTAPPGQARTSPPSGAPRAGTDGRPCKVYAAAQEDPSTRGNYTAGGLYAPDVRDTTPDYVPDVNCIAEPVVTHEPRSAIGNRTPYEVLGKQYHVLDRTDGYVESGTASYYGAKFHGRRTSNLEVYDMYAFTAAHKSLPLPSFARVTNLDNGQSVVVRVNDRGPFHEGRVIDLSYAAAVKLGITQRGTGRVEVRALTPDDTGTLLASAPSRPVPPAAALTPMDELVNRLPQDSVIGPGVLVAARDTKATPVPAATAPASPASRATPGDSHRYHVDPNVGGTPSADGFDAWMQSRGVRVATGKPATPAAGTATSSSPRNASPAPAPAAAAEVRAVAARADSERRTATGAKDVQLQVGSFASRENADRALAQLGAAGVAGTLSSVVSQGRTLWRLRVGAPDTVSAQSLATRIAGLGFGQPQFVRE